MRDRLRESGSSVFLAVLLVASVAAPFAAGLAGAQSSTYSHTFKDTGNVRVVGFDTSGWSADTFTVEVSTDNGPGDNHVVLYREQHTLASIPKGNDGWVWFENAGAYNQITVTVKQASNQPSFGIGADTSTVSYPNDARLASTGGDRDLIADPLEKLATATNPAVNIVDVSVGRGGIPDSTTVNESKLAELDANETKLEIYQSAASSGDSAETIHTIMNNRLQDAETVALIKGKNAYIRELNTGGSKTAAKSAATENISEFYAQQEANLIAEWNSQVADAEYLMGLSANDSALSGDYVRASYSNSIDQSRYDFLARTIESVGTTQKTLQNGTNVDVRTITLNLTTYINGADTLVSAKPTRTIDDKAFSVDWDSNADVGQYSPGSSSNVSGIEVQPPTEDYSAETFIDFDKYTRSLSTIESQSTNAQNQMDTVVNQTYDAYTAGQINSTDLVNPYDLQNQASPGNDFQGWAAATLAVSGTNQPIDFDSTGYMNVTLEDGTELQGIIHSTENPPNGQFEVNQTYDPSVVNGTQYMVTDDSLRELTQNFTLTNLTTTDGEYRQNFTVVEKTYETTSADDLEKLNQQMMTLRELINARQQNTRGGIGGGGFLGGSQSAYAVVGLIALLLIFAMASDGGGGGGRRR